jgi:hypothetical protein
MFFFHWFFFFISYNTHIMKWTSQNHKWVQTTKKEKKICACPKTFKFMIKWSIINHNVHDKNTILISLILQSTFILVLCFKQITTPKSLIHDFSHDWVASCYRHPWLGNVIFKISFSIIIMKGNVFYDYDFCKYNHERHQIIIIF